MLGTKDTDPIRNTPPRLRHAGGPNIEADVARGERRPHQKQHAHAHAHAVACHAVACRAANLATQDTCFEAQTPSTPRAPAPTREDCSTAVVRTSAADGDGRQISTEAVPRAELGVRDAHDRATCRQSAQDLHGSAEVNSSHSARSRCWNKCNRLSPMDPPKRESTHRHSKGQRAHRLALRTRAIRAHTCGWAAQSATVVAQGTAVGKPIHCSHDARYDAHHAQHATVGMTAVHVRDGRPQHCESTLRSGLRMQDRQGGRGKAERGSDAALHNRRESDPAVRACVPRDPPT
jgi:hypothetical protein